MIALFIFNKNTKHWIISMEFRHLSQYYQTNDDFQTKEESSELEHLKWFPIQRKNWTYKSQMAFSKCNNFIVKLIVSIFTHSQISDNSNNNNVVKHIQFEMFSMKNVRSYWCALCNVWRGGEKIDNKYLKLALPLINYEFQLIIRDYWKIIAFIMMFTATNAAAFNCFDKQLFSKWNIDRVDCFAICWNWCIWLFEQR